MKITKLGHCCLLIEENGLRILTDPGNYSEGQMSVKNIDLILITHEHNDHVHIISLKEELKNNPNAEIYTNKAVGLKLEKDNINFHNLDKPIIIGETIIEPFNTIHAEIYKTIPAVQNTCFFINNRFFYPGDSFYNPKKPVEILALPVAGPWMKLSEAIEYALKIAPKYAFPVHDGMLIPGRIGSPHERTKIELENNSIKFIVATEGTKMEF